MRQEDINRLSRVADPEAFAASGRLAPYYRRRQHKARRLVERILDEIRQILMEPL